MLLKRTGTATLSVLEPRHSRRDQRRQHWMESHGGFPSEKSQGTRWLPPSYRPVPWGRWLDEPPNYNPRALTDRRSTFSYCISQCGAGAKSLLFSANMVILFNLPAYHRGRALHLIQGLSANTDADSHLKTWEMLIRPLMEEWKTVCVLATLVSGAALAMFQISSFNNNPILPALAYLTLLCTMTAILLSSIVIIHLGGETSDLEFVQTWLEKFRNTDHRSLWSVWLIVSLPSVWTAWGALVFISSVVFLFWSKSGATATVNAASSSSLTTSNAAATPEPSSDIPSFLTAVVLLGFFNILYVVFSFWKQGRPRSTPLETA